MLTGQNGILNRAQEAKEKTEQAQKEESDKITEMEAMVQSAGTKVTNPSSYGENPNAQATSDGAGKYFALPTGASYITGTVDTGVVVNIKGSEFVWVPVKDVVLDTSRATELPISEENGTSMGKTYTPMAVKVGDDYKGILYNFSGNNGYLIYNNSSNNYLGDSTGWREPDEVSYDIGSYKDEKITSATLILEYNAMIESVLKYKGFYIARYEAGLDSDNNIVFKNASQTENGVTTTDASNSQTEIWYGLYKKIKTFATMENTEDKVVSSMIWGSQYDAMMNWMVKNGKNVGDVNETKVNKDNVTGKNTEDVLNNIYDLYGCHYEWTLETYDKFHRVCRGSYYGRDLSAAQRNYSSPVFESSLLYTEKYFSSRATLYIK